MGYGARLMSHVLKYLLTCADNAAVPYFEKQGFTTRITLPNDQWQGRIKEYDGVTLMEGKLLHLNYLNIPMVIKAMKMTYVEKIKDISHAHVVYPSMHQQEDKLFLIEQITGIENTSWNKINRSNSNIPYRFGYADRSQAAMTALQEHLETVLDELMKHRSAALFFFTL